MVDNLGYSKILLNMRLIIFCLLIIFQSCCPRKETVSSISETNKKWNPYIQGQQIIMTSDSLVDTLIVVKAQTEIFVSGECETLKKEIKKTVLHSKKDSMINISFSLWSTFINFNSILKYDGIDEEYDFVSSKFWNKDSKSQIIEKITLNGKEYTNVLLIKERYPSPNNVSFYYAKETGLIQFQYNGNEYILN